MADPRETRDHAAKDPRSPFDFGSGGEDRVRDFSDVPDPAAAVARRAIPGVVLPAERAPTRAERRNRILIGLGLAAAWLVALLLRFGMRGDLDPMSLAKMAVWAAVGVVAAVLVLPSRKATLGPAARALRLAVLAVPVAFVVASAAMAQGAPDEGLAPAALLGCALSGLALAAGPVALAALVARRALPVDAAWRGAVLGGLGGLLGSIAIQAHCPVDACAHVVIAHGAPLVLGALLGAAFGSRYGRL